MRIRWTRSARKHRIGRTSAREALENAGTPTVLDDGKLCYVGPDSQGRELEIVAVPDGEDLIVIHVMPAAWRSNKR